MNLFWANNRNFERAIENAVAASTVSGTAKPPVQQDRRDVDERVDQLLLVCAAMLELICEKTSLTQEDLINRVAMLDARDGVADGKMTRTPQKCDRCNRVLSAKHSKCLYCGAAIPIENVFKTI